MMLPPGTYWLRTTSIGGSGESVYWSEDERPHRGGRVARERREREAVRRDARVGRSTAAMVGASTRGSEAHADLGRRRHSDQRQLLLPVDDN
jgi:hypothetical protein